MTPTAPVPTKLRMFLNSLLTAVIASVVYLVIGILQGHSSSSITFTVIGMLVVITLVNFLAQVWRYSPPRSSRKV
ncbi:MULTISPECIES: hypothetical protein [Microbacterium]|uniref:hypothetical protein n=1 Tax=Microbacterium TaxID=33882 RepID=UPI0023DBEB68|nr:MULTISPECIES: hypothetical protein [Microbacterium]MDF2046055.1 hypothetical protein [Microbacterium sp. Kw_RZR3]MDF2919950.1 hypothetical protein [Microbacterium sp.]MDQ1075895.1 ABC-type glycerol-3-phosphate transport system permease component [Microbacterium sp. SORGH_AS_0969]MDQ1116139.1 ABC-type glycerol-3-phosphate transport system permease component [Microbacterium testaceum]